jgi:hypothetical protein
MAQRLPKARQRHEAMIASIKGPSCIGALSNSQGLATIPGYGRPKPSPIFTRFRTVLSGRSMEGGRFGHAAPCSELLAQSTHAPLGPFAPILKPLSLDAL